MARNRSNRPATQTWQKKIFEVIFEADSHYGKRFDVVLLWLIVISVIVVMLESVDDISRRYEGLLTALEWGFTIVFTIEYVMRLLCVKKPLRYMFSFFGLVDLLSILPTYLGIFFGGAASLRIVRILRFMRIFRVLKLIGFLKEASVLTKALKASRQKVTVFLVGVFMVVTILGTVMYIIEDHEAGFTSIPRSIYWAIVTLTTVGYGDIAPETALGQSIASMVMILGYAIIAVPTGIVTAELGKQTPVHSNTKACQNCGTEGHRDGANHCYNCGEPLDQT